MLPLFLLAEYEEDSQTVPPAAFTVFHQLALLFSICRVCSFPSAGCAVFHQPAVLFPSAALCYIIVLSGAEKIK